MLVKVPSFSVCAAAGKKNTSVAMSSGSTSPATTSGEVRQNSAVSFSWKSRTTSHFSFCSPLRCRAPFIDPAAGFSPTTK